MSSKLFAVVAGAGTGTGRAVALRFAKAYPVVLMARRPESYQDTVSKINEAGGRAVGVSVDVTDGRSIGSAFGAIQKELSGLKLAAAVYNVSRGLFNFAQKTIPLLLEAVPESEHSPTLLITGATASVRGSAKFGTLAAGMFARRALAQSLAREFHPQGVHVAHSIIDGIIDIPRTQGHAATSGVEDGKLKPEAIAESYWHLHTQPRSAYTQELDLRPFVEGF
ncbi:NAD(P)-binding protein [Xylaria acuta]|nr:NAD(P)-binding protein [Xylaria acuta]